MMKARLMTILSLVGAVALAPSARGAKVFEAPTKMAQTSYKQVAVVVAKSSPEDGRVLFKRKKELFGKMPRTLVARVDPEVIEGLTWGERYVIAYTAIRNNPLDRESKEIDPEGPQVLKFPAMGQFLVRDGEEIRSLLELARDESPAAARTRLAAVSALMTSGDPASRRLAIVELYMSPGLIERVGEAEAEAIRGVVASWETDAELRGFMLEAARRMPEAVRGAWVLEESRAILKEAGPDLELASTVPFMVRTAVETVGEYGGPSDAPLLAAHFESNNPGVAKAALKALEGLEPDLAARKAREVLGRPELHASTRQAMEAFLERYRKGEVGGS